MLRSKLTNTAVERFQCREGREQDILWDGEIRGFGMRLSAQTGTRTYFIQYRIKGRKRERQVTIGRHGDPYRVDQARAKAIQIKTQMLEGADPVEEYAKREVEARDASVLRKAHSAMLREVLEHYLVHRRTKHGPLRERTKDDMRRHCEVNLKTWMDKPMVKVVTRASCLEQFTKMSARAPTQANCCMVYLRALCNHAREMYATDEGEYLIFGVNPVTQMLRIRKLNPTRARKGRIPKDRIGHVWNYLRVKSVEARRDVERTAADWLSFLLLTCMRLTESCSLKRTDVDLVAKSVLLRADVVKNHNELTLPMSTALYQILSDRLTRVDNTAAARRRRRERSSLYVFPSFGRKKPFITDARAMLVGVSKIAGRHITVHDFRRTAEDILKFCKVDPDERRILLNHVAGDVHGVHYGNDSDPETLRPALEAMAQWVLQQAEAARERV